MIRPVIIAGATASGKSELALRVAERDGGCVINADAMQVYDCWRILTARPGPADLARAPHRLYGHISCARGYSAGAWLRDLAPVLEDLRARGVRPIIVGGAGLYLTAATVGLAEIPAISAEVRARSDQLIRAGRLDVLSSQLARIDPETHAGIDRDNPMRVQRAWDVVTATHRGLADWRRERTAPLLDLAASIAIVISPEQSFLNKMIEERFRQMLEHGALDECRAFIAGFPAQTPGARALGARELIGHLQGRTSLDAAAEAAVTATRQYARRQRKWFRGRMADWRWIDPGQGDPLRAIPRR